MDEEGSTVHVWHASLSAPVASALLSDDERERAGRFRFDRDRQRFIACRSALRQILAGRLGNTADQIVFAYGPRGKPYVAGSKIRFNLSHSGDDALIAIATGRDVGIDVERPDGQLSPDELAAQFLTAVERAWVESAPHEKRLIAFLACWTRKEAWAKAIGTGLSEDLARFDVSGSLNVASCVLCHATTGTKWTVSELALSDNLIGAIVVEGTNVTVNLHRFDET
jgi:4'-phosphopantetheinyl transferase